MQVIILLASLSALSAAAVDMYLPAFPTVALSLNISPGQVQQTLTVYLIGLGIGQGLYGPLLDRFGRKPPLLVGLALFALGSITAALTISFYGLLIARFFQAIGAAAGLVAARAIVTDTCDTHNSARIYSMLTQMMMIAPISAPTVGSLILIYGDWRLIFWLLTLLSIICWGCTVSILTETLMAESRVALSARNIMHNYAVQIYNPSFLLYALASGFTFGGLFIYVTTSPFIFISIFGLTPTQFGYIFALNAIAMILIGQLNLRLLNFYSAIKLLYFGLFCFISIGILLLILVNLNGLANLFIYWLLLGLGLAMLGLITGNITAVTMAHTQKHAGTTSALMGLIQFLLAAVVGFIFSFTEISLNTLPAALIMLGTIALILCVFAQKYTFKASNKNEFSTN